jgi:hypothetical protein
MFSRLKDLETWCDAPPYGVVRACKSCGFDSPLDVRWCNMRRSFRNRKHRWAIWALRPWQWLFTGKEERQDACTCGQLLAEPQEYTFAWMSGKIGDYSLVQCERCRTIYWDEILPLPVRMEKRVLR